MPTTLEAPPAASADQTPAPEFAVPGSLAPAITEPAQLDGSVVEDGIKKNHPDVQDDLRWWWRYSIEKKFSLSEAAGELGVDASVISRVFRGAYKNGKGLVIHPPTIMVARIRTTRKQLYAQAKEAGRSRVMTPTVAGIHRVCRMAWKRHQIAFVFGLPHLGKSEALKWFRDENNHGRTLYVNLQGVTGVQDIYREFARALGFSGECAPTALAPRVHAAIDKDNLVIVDEFHATTYSYQKKSALRMIEAVRSIKDRSGCAMVICATDVGRAELETGHDSALLAQLDRRGVIKEQLPPALRVGDVRAIARAKGLPFPDAPKKAEEDLWEQLLKDDFPAAALCDRIAFKHGIEHLFTVLDDGEQLARNAGVPLSWHYVIRAQAIYDGFSAKKRV